MAMLQGGMTLTYFVEISIATISNILYSNWCIWGVQYRFVDWMKGLSGLFEVGTYYVSY